MTEQAPNKTELANARKRKAPELSVDEEGKLTVGLESENQLEELFGVKSKETANGLMLGALNALGKKGEMYRDLMIAMTVEMEPRDAIEAMLISQMTATHIAMTMLTTRTVDATSPELREGYERSMTRLSRTFLAQVESFKKYRAKAQQTVRVERVTVNEGGQAIVGAVAHGGRVNDEK
ncbi:hypothetical protein [Pseudohalocynthiibacter sp. F2068]|uniref:hypothetical protein n=1 Tax=Pseudohalocynthiibacter sp. F2068 TaxID=2926418 RepID=UPI001FF2E2D4|nr:hypothetical protein [Pseudohalocynthiibacter sp. F2068]MCK0101187.1 hypothetical protein [Pseudohalocynthiibacter sp. F2068]